MAYWSRGLLWVMAVWGVAALVACDEEAQPNHVPRFSEAVQWECQPSAVTDLEGEVLINGTVSVLDENLVGVDVAIPGLGRVQMGRVGDPPEAQDKEVPQAFAFFLAPEDKILCGPLLTLTFSAWDASGAVTTLNVIAQ